MNDPLAHYYARRAAEYEQIYRKPERQADLQRLARVLPDLLAGATLLEVACGTGYWTQHLAATAHFILATDLNDAVLARARRKTYPAGRVQFQRADALRLAATLDPAAAPGPFTAGFAGFWWSHLPHRQQASFLDGWHRVLGPGARVVLLDNRFVDGSSTPIARRDGDGNTYQHRRLRDGSLHEVLKNFPTEDALRTVLHGRGTNVTWAGLDYYWYATYRVA